MFFLSLQKMGIQNTTARETQTAAEALERAKSQLLGEWGWRGDRGEGQAAWWVVGHVWAWSRKGGRQKGGKPGSKEHATGKKADMPVRASAAPFQVAGLRTLPKLGGEGPAPAHLYQSCVDSGTDPHGHVSGWGGGHRLHRGHEHKRKPQANSLTQNIRLDTGWGRGDARGSVGPPAYGVITCPVSGAEYFCRT